MRLSYLFCALTVLVLAFSLPQAGAAESQRAEAKPALKAATKHRAGKKVAASKRKPVVRVAAVPLKPSFGQIAGLHQSHDTLALKSSVALVIDQDTNEVLFSKNDKAVLPIASLTKLMTGLVVSEARLPMDEVITISQSDVDTEKAAHRA